MQPEEALPCFALYYICWLVNRIIIPIEAIVASLCYIIMGLPFAFFWFFLSFPTARLVLLLPNEIWGRWAGRRKEEKTHSRSRSRRSRREMARRRAGEGKEEGREERQIWPTERGGGGEDTLRKLISASLSLFRMVSTDGGAARRCTS